MSRLARIVLPGVVHHITQRGARSMDVFFKESDRIDYLNFLKEQSDRAGLEFVGYCLMTNHVHLLVIPRFEDSLRRGIGEVHRLYTRQINFRMNTRGHLFQARFFSCPLDASHFIAAARYVERNPVRARMTETAEEYLYSSARYHVGIQNHDPLIDQKYSGIGSEDEWRKWLKLDPYEIEKLRTHFSTGRILGSQEFIKNAEFITGRDLLPKSPGRSKNK